MSSQAKRVRGSVVSLQKAADSRTSHRVGSIVGMSEDARSFLVDYPGNPAGPVPSLSTVQVDEATATRYVEGRQAVLLCFDAAGATATPVIVGIVQDAIAPRSEEPSRVRATDEALVLEHDKRIELRCGETVLILTRDGKLLTRAAYISAYSSGAYRVRGASVEIN